MSIDRYKRTRFFHKNNINGILENDLPFNNFQNFEFRRQKSFYTVQEDDIQRPDIISFRNYGKPNLWWIIMKLNEIEDVWNDLNVGDVLTIPHLNDVEEFVLKNKINV